MTLPSQAGERPHTHRKMRVAAHGQRSPSDNDTPALNALTALRGAPTSMGRGETPVSCSPAAIRCTPFQFNILAEIAGQTAQEILLCLSCYFKLLLCKQAKKEAPNGRF